MEKRAADLHSSLTSTVERYRLLEDSTTQEKTQLRRDKQELERLIRLKEEEAGQRQVLAIAKAEAKAQSATAQLESVMKQLDQAQQALVHLRRELKAAQTDNKQIQGTIRSLHNDMKVRNEDVERLTSELSIATTAAESKAVLLQQSEARIEASAQEIKRQQALLDEQAHQVQLLEAKLSRSVPVDDEELLSRQQREESAWHQRVSALEHALVAERQNTSLFRDQQRKAVAMEQEKAAHAMEQAQAVAAELATANLCLLERKRQREQEQHAFDAKLKEYADRIVQLTSDKDALEGDSDTLRSQHEQLRQRMERGAEDAATAKNKMQEELAVVKDELKNLMEIRENLDRALAHALASPRGRSARHQASLSEVRVELQKAKQKIAVLEDQLSRNGLIRKSEIDGLKKQRATERLQIEKERAELEQQREDQAAAESKHKIDHDLLKQIIVLLAQRLKILVALFDTESMSCSSHDEGAASGNAEAGSTRPPSENVETWRGIQQQWKALHQGLEDADWKLVDMRSRLEALHLEYLGQSMPPLEFTQQPSRSALLPGFHGPNPFSDAVAAGRDTVPVADQLKASRLLRRLSCPGERLESRARQVKGASFSRLHHAFRPAD
ncbi:unnamed protein product [Phytophthora lilii]|uniref:Unnamed protein product n=1 Tax=Phytophthora lilii TaxID=2077276 RepID=A0A9W6WYE7_9STRA|nr:unnamed protein product [Phytophthora lilii]